MAGLPVLKQLLDPRQLVAQSKELLEPGVIQRCWPVELAGAQTFFTSLKSRYDHTQLGAIEVPTYCAPLLWLLCLLPSTGLYNKQQQMSV
jgi:hypothetical protein